MTRLHSLWRQVRRPDDSPDEDLLHRFARTGDEAAFAELVARYGPVVYGASRRLLSNPADVEDAFQATFLVLVARADAVPGRSVGPWLYRVAVWTARNLRRRNARRAAVPLGPQAAAPAPPTDLRLDLDAALMALPAKYRTPVVLCHLRGWSRRDAAAHLGCPEGTLSALLSRGLAKLRRRLAGADPRAAVAVVPAALAATTVRSAAAYRTASLSAAASPAVADLTRGVLRMFWVKKLAAAGLVVAAVAVTGLGIGLRSGNGPRAVAQDTPPRPAAKPAQTPDEIAARIKELETEIAKLKAQADALRAEQMLAEYEQLLRQQMALQNQKPSLRIEVRDANGLTITVTEYDRGGKKAGQLETHDVEMLRRFLTRTQKDPAGPKAVRIAADGALPAAKLKAVVEACDAAGFSQVDAEVKPQPAEPRKSGRASLPAYVIEPPDILRLMASVRTTESNALGVYILPFNDEYLVRPDGTVSLGKYGSVQLAGKTIDEATAAVRKHLAGHPDLRDGGKADRLDVSLNVAAYNSKKYYVILGGPKGESVYAFPVTGSDTVLDAVAATHGAAEVAARGNVYIARPKDGGQQTLPVDWVGLTRHGQTTTNYQLLPGDRLYVVPKDAAAKPGGR